MNTIGMKTANFLDKFPHRFDDDDDDAINRGLFDAPDMADVWDNADQSDNYDVLMYIATCKDVFHPRLLRLAACNSIRDQPITDNRRVWDLLVHDELKQAVDATQMYSVWLYHNMDLKESHDKVDAICRKLEEDSRKGDNRMAMAEQAAALAAFYVSDPDFCAFDFQCVVEMVLDAAACDAHVKAGGSATDDIDSVDFKEARRSICRKIAALGNPFKEDAGDIEVTSDTGRAPTK